MKVKAINDKIKNGLGMIAGIPTSGTTVINSFFNSCKNIFSVSEPYLEHEETGICQMGKLPPHRGDWESIKDHMRIYAESEQYNFGLFKETYTPLRDNNESSFERAISMPSDFYVIVLREPAYHYDAKVGVNEILKEIDHFLEFYSELENEELCIPVLYEKFCDDPKHYMNKVFEGVLQFEGKEELIEETFYAGHNRSNKSVEVKPARRKLRNLSVEEASKVNERFRDRYEDIFGQEMFPIPPEKMIEGE